MYEPPPAAPNDYSPPDEHPADIPPELEVDSVDGEAGAQSFVMTELLQAAAENARTGAQEELSAARQTIRDLESELEVMREDAREAAERGRGVAEEGQEREALLAHSLEVAQKEVRRLAAALEAANTRNEQANERWEAQVEQGQVAVRESRAVIVALEEDAAEKAGGLAEAQRGWEQADEAAARATESAALSQRRLEESREEIEALERHIEGLRADAAEAAAGAPARRDMTCADAFIQRLTSSCSSGVAVGAEDAAKEDELGLLRSVRRDRIPVDSVLLRSDKAAICSRRSWRCGAVWRRWTSRCAQARWRGPKTLNAQPNSCANHSAFGISAFLHDCGHFMAV